MDLTALKAAELTTYTRALTDELALWRERTEDGAELQTHNSQVRRLETQLTGLIKAITPSADADLAALQKAQGHLVEAHRIWSFFRSKLSQRDAIWTSAALRVADELAWACYRPVRDAAVAAGSVKLAAVKEPPLVYMDGENCPVVRPRGESFFPGLSSRTAEDSRFSSVVLSLPIPIVGYPRFQGRHAPGVSLVAHEVGHAVEEDFSLGVDLQERILKAVSDDTRRQAWQAWQREVFADVFATLGVGFGFPAALVGYLAKSSEKLESQSQSAPFAAYPTDTLRVLLCAQTLETLGLIEDATLLRDSWPATHRMSAYEADLEPIVKALTKQGWDHFGGASLAEILSRALDDNEPTQLDRVRSRAKGFNTSDALIKGTSPRELCGILSTAWWLDPSAFAAREAAKPVLELLEGAFPGQVRSAADEYDPPGGSTALATADTANGTRLAGLLTPTE